MFETVNMKNNNKLFINPERVVSIEIKDSVGWLQLESCPLRVRIPLLDAEQLSSSISNPTNVYAK
jgi:hypothetical protein